MEIYLNIKLIRQKKCYSQLYMANQLNISQSCYNKIENGQSQISINRFYEISRIFGLSMEELYNFNNLSSKD